MEHKIDALNLIFISKYPIFFLFSEKKVADLFYPTWPTLPHPTLHANGNEHGYDMLKNCSSLFPSSSGRRSRSKWGKATWTRRCFGTGPPVPRPTSSPPKASTTESASRMAARSAMASISRKIPSSPYDTGMTSVAAYFGCSSHLYTAPRIYSYFVARKVLRR